MTDYRTRLLLSILLCAAVAAMPQPAAAQTPSPAEGYWHGDIDMTTSRVAVDLWLNRNPEGAWGGSFGAPQWNIYESPVIVTGDGKSVSIRTFVHPIPIVNGTANANTQRILIQPPPVLNGTVSADGNTLSGVFTIDESPFPFRLTRQAGPPPEKALVRARNILDLIRAGKFEDVVKQFDAQLSAQLPADKLSQDWATVRAAAGDYKSEIAVHITHFGAVTAVTIGCQFEKAPRNLLIVFAPDESIVTLQFQPRPPAAAVALP